MPDLSVQTIFERYSQTIVKHSDQLALLQLNLMDARLLELNRLGNSISLDIRLSDPAANLPRTALYDRTWLDEFALGDITRCLGQEFHIYAGRKSPRIPNGDLLLMSRVNEIHGIKGNFENRSKITAEYDVPQDAWFLSPQENGSIPMSMLMEMALQPCGVLSAWLHTQLKYPDIDFSFRNLDGAIQIVEEMDLRGKTITTHAMLEKTVFSGSTIIQHFSFCLLCDGRTFLNGKTTFGYFPEETMTSQVGLDSGRKVEPWGNLPKNAGSLANNVIPMHENANNKLQLIDTIRFARQSEEKPFGYVLAERKNSPSDWYYSNHFLGDPVMPGSLGIEMIYHAFKDGLFSISTLFSGNQSVVEQGLQWKYRGQVLPHTSNVAVDVTIIDEIKRPDSVICIANANLWADDLRIYEISNLMLTVYTKGK